MWRPLFEDESLRWIGSASLEVMFVAGLFGVLVNINGAACRGLTVAAVVIQFGLPVVNLVRRPLRRPLDGIFLGPMRVLNGVMCLGAGLSEVQVPHSSLETAVFVLTILLAVCVGVTTLLEVIQNCRRRAGKPATDFSLTYSAAKNNAKSPSSQHNAKSLSTSNRRWCFDAPELSTASTSNKQSLSETTIGNASSDSSYAMTLSGTTTLFIRSEKSLLRLPSPTSKQTASEENASLVQQSVSDGSSAVFSCEPPEFINDTCDELELPNGSLPDPSFDVNTAICDDSSGVIQCVPSLKAILASAAQVAAMVDNISNSFKYEKASVSSLNLHVDAYSSSSIKFQRARASSGTLMEPSPSSLFITTRLEDNLEQEILAGLSALQTSQKKDWNVTLIDDG